MVFSHPDYRLIRELGHGGSASVHLAVQKSLGRRVALKVLHAASLRDPAAGARFLREARTIATLVHPHIVPVFEVGRRADEFGYFMTMEYLAGGTLPERIERMTLGELLRAIDRIADALACAHDRGFVHRDVKADNILFRTDGEAVLTDFGIARLTESATLLTATGAILGTPGYMSPEQVRGETLDARSDLYSLGIVLYEGLAGVRPFVGDSVIGISLQHLTTPPPPLRGRAERFQPLMDRLLAKAPDERPPDADALRAALRALRRRLPPGETDAPLGEWREAAVHARERPSTDAPARYPHRRRPRGASRSRRLASSFVVATLGLAVIALLAVPRPGDAPSPLEPLASGPGPDAKAIVTDARAPDPTPLDPIPSVGESARASAGADVPDTVAPAEPAAEPSPPTALVTAADEAFLADRWFGDGEDTAVALLHRILESVPGEERATARLARMRETTLRRADTALDGDDPDTAARRIDALEAHWPEAPDVAARRVRLDEIRARRAAAARDAERRRRAGAYLAEAERALSEGALDLADERLERARASLPEHPDIGLTAERLAAARARAEAHERERRAAAALDARIAALSARFDDWSDAAEARLDATWESIDAELRALRAEHPDDVSLQRLARVAERQARLIARADESAPELVTDAVADDSAERFHLPGF